MGSNRAVCDANVGPELDDNNKFDEGAGLVKVSRVAGDISLDCCWRDREKILDSCCWSCDPMRLNLSLPEEFY